MKYMWKWLPVMSIFFFSMACSSSRPVPYHAGWKSAALYDDHSEADQTDMKSRLRYGVRNNREFLFLHLKTREPDLVRSILTNGIVLSFKPGNERRPYGKLTFPVLSKQDKRALRRMRDTDLYGPGMALLVETFNKEALWTDRNSQRFIDLINDHNDIACRMSISQDNELTIRYELPFSRIGVDPATHASLQLAFQIDDAGTRQGFAPGVSVGMGTGGFGMGGMGVSVGTGRRQGYGNQGTTLRLDVRLADGA